MLACVFAYEEESFEIGETNRRTSVPVDLDLLLATCREVNARKEEGRRRSQCVSVKQPKLN